MALDPRTLAPKDIIDQASVQASTPPGLKTFDPVCQHFNRQIGYGLLRPRDIGQIIAQYASSQQRAFIGGIGSDVRMTVTHFKGGEEADRVISTLTRHYPKRVPMADFARVVHDSRIMSFFSGKARTIPAEAYDPPEGVYLNAGLLSDQNTPATLRDKQQEIFAHGESFDDFIERRRLKPEDLMQAAESCPLPRGMNLKDAIPRLLDTVTAQKHYWRLTPEAALDALGEDAKALAFACVSSRMSKRDHGLVTQPKDIVTKDIEDKRAIQESFSEAQEKAQPTGRSAKTGRPVPAARVKKTFDI